MRLTNVTVLWSSVKCTEQHKSTQATQVKECYGAVTHSPSHEFCNIILPFTSKALNNIAVGNLVSCHDAYLTLIASVLCREHIYYCHEMMDL